MKKGRAAQKTLVTVTIASSCCCCSLKSLFCIVFSLNFDPLVNLDKTSNIKGSFINSFILICLEKLTESRSSIGFSLYKYFSATFLKNWQEYYLVKIK